MEGMGSEPHQQELTLDEPVWTTLKRDLTAIALKIRHVVLPNGRGTKALRDWDLWGPLLLCLILAVIVALSTENTDDYPGKKSLMFAVVFAVVSLGSLIVTFNAKFLGGKISIFQSVCVIGYCMFPLTLGALVISIAAAAGFDHIIFRGLLVLVTLAWSTWASVGFMGALVEAKRKLLAVYPVLLFYVIIAWLVLVTVHSSSAAPPVTTTA